jgi:RNA polymerase-binding transcription factor DksA
MVTGEVQDVTPRPEGEADVAVRLQEQRAATARRVAALRRDREGIVDSAALVATDDEHDPEGATLAFEREQLAALLAAACSELDEIDAALARLADGSYGRCLRCGGPIASGRLQVRPNATRCIRCASRP